VKQFEPPKLNFTVPEQASILIADTNTVYGGNAGKAMNDIRTLYPKANLYFASANLDYSYESPKFIWQTFYGTLSNGRRNLTIDDEQLHNITHDILVFPWEDLEVEWQEISASEQLAEP
jgi:hypothetical protein